MRNQVDDVTRAAVASQAFYRLVVGQGTHGWSRMITSRNSWLIWYELRAIAREVLRSCTGL